MKSDKNNLNTELSPLLSADSVRLLKLCICAVFCWGLAAHAYGFFRASFSHDMLNALTVTEVETYWKMQLGRPGIVLYRRLLRGGVAAPWLLGLLSLLWLSLCCFVIVKLFRVQGNLFPILTAGVLCANLTVLSMTAGYLYEMDANLFAAFVGSCAVFLWDRHSWRGCVLGIPLVAFCMGTYQSMVSVPITLCMLVCIFSLLRGERAADVLKKGLLAVFMLLAGIVLYWLLIRLMCALKGITLSPDSYNSVSPEEQRTLFSRFASVYRTWAEAFWMPSKTHIEPFVLAGNILLPLFGLTGMTVLCRKRKIGAAELLLLLLLLCLLPLGMNTAQLAFSRDVHELMKFAFWLFWLLCLFPFFRIFDSDVPFSALPFRKLSCFAAAAVLLSVLFCNVVTANRVYTRKDLEQQASLSLMTRVLCRLEEQPDYDPFTTPLVFVGVSPLLRDRLPGFEDTYDINGCEDSDPLVKSDVTYYYNTYAACFRYLLNNPAVMAGTEDWNRLQQIPEIETMPCYPEDGCMRLIDGFMVVKLG